MEQAPSLSPPVAHQLCGPWDYDPERTRVRDALHCTVCLLPHVGNGTGDLGRAIAALPELLRAVRLVYCLRLQAQDIYDRPEWCEAWRLAEEALAKVRGD